MILRYAGGHAGRGKAQLGRFHPANFITQARSFFEFQIGCRVFHILFQVGNHSLIIIAHKISRFCTGLWGQMIAFLINGIQHIGNIFPDRFRGDAMGFVPSLLLRAAPFGLGQCIFHRVRDPVAIENYPTINIPRRPSNGLDQ